MRTNQLRKETMDIIEKMTSSTDESVNRGRSMAVPAIIMVAATAVGYGVVKTLTRSSDRFIDAVITTTTEE